MPTRRRQSSTPSRAIAVTALAWFDELQYARMLQLADDAASMPAMFEAWRAKAESTEQEARRCGQVVIRIYIDTGDLARWCLRYQRSVDSAARAAHAAERAQRATAPSILTFSNRRGPTSDELMAIVAVRFLLAEHPSIDPDDLRRDRNLSSIIGLADRYGLHWRPQGR